MKTAHRASRQRAADRFQRVRDDHSREMAEDYTELVLELESSDLPVRPADLARALGVSHVTVLRTLTRLERQSLIERDTEAGIRLTRAGRRLAQSARRRHAVVVKFLQRIGVPLAQSESDAEGIEHHCSALTLRQMRAFLRS
ncbi:MAG: iron dependent repressor, metal binding and dimerization domain protein [Acidobacteriota bacterium]